MSTAVIKREVVSDCNEYISTGRILFIFSYTRLATSKPSRR